MSITRPALPLSNLRILVTRSSAQAGDLSRRLAEMGAEPVEAPLIRTEDPEDRTPLDRAVAELDAYDWLIFTSVNAVEKFFERLSTTGRDFKSEGRPRVAVVGTATATRLKQYGVVADFQPEQFDAESLVKGLGAFRSMRGATVLFPGADIAREAVVTGLSGLGARVTTVVAYRTVAEPSLPPRVLAMLEDRQIHAVTFTSSSTVKAFVGAVDETRMAAYLSGVTVVCMGPITARTAEEMGLRVDLIPDEATIPALVGAIVEKMGAI